MELTKPLLSLSAFGESKVIHRFVWSDNLDGSNQSHSSWIFLDFTLKKTGANQKIAMQSWKNRKRVKETMRIDAFGMVNRVKFENAQWLKGPVALPPNDFEPLGYADVSS